MIPASLQARLARPRVAAAVVLLGVLLCAPSLGNGLNLDDVLQAARHADGHATAWNLFDLFGGAEPMVATADQPWWRHDAMRLELMRPLAALTHLFDLRLFAASPVWMHIHSLLWYALLLALAGRVYRRFLPGPHAWALALLLYALDHTHGMVVGWLAARSAILGTLGALVCLLAHDRWRRDLRPRHAALALLALVTALLASEGAVGVVGYLAAYALCLDRGTWRARFLSLLPAAIVVVTWRACYVAAGYGAAHSGFYFDPSADPLGFLAHAAVHAVLLVGSAALVPLGELLGAAPGLYGPAAAVVTALLLAILWWVRRDLRGSPALRFWAIAALLSSLPLGTTLPTDRQLLLVGFAVFGFVACLLSRPPDSPPRLFIRVLAWIWLAVHLLLSPLLLPLRAASPAMIHALAEGAAAVVATAPDRVILVRVPSDLFMLYGRAIHRMHARPFPASLQYLYAGLDTLTISRIDDQTLELTPARGWLHAPLDQLYRDPIADPLHAGQRISRDGYQVEILAVHAGAPTRVRLRYDRPLEQMTWFTWEGRIPRPYTLPAIGESHTSAAQSNPLLAP